MSSFFETVLPLAISALIAAAPVTVGRLAVRTGHHLAWRLAGIAGGLVIFLTGAQIVLWDFRSGSEYWLFAAMGVLALSVLGNLWLSLKKWPNLTDVDATEVFK